MFLIGDRVVHPMHGAGIIENIIEERLAGKLGRYYVFRMPVGGLVLKIPTDNCGSIGVRALSTAAQIEEIFHKIPSLPVEINSNWNRRYRENMMRLKSGDLLEVARVVKGLMRRDVDRGLSTGERKMLHSAKQILISEIVLSQNASYEDVEARINGAMA